MRRILYLLLVVVMLAVPASSVFAAEPQIIEQIPSGDFYLGELVLIYTDIWDPMERVDAFLYRPATGEYPAGWPLTAQAPIDGPTGNTWWKEEAASQQRRWSFADTEGTIFETSDMFGIWAVILMIPRDENWYPCSFPLKWKCNYYSAEAGYELHSPQLINYLPSSTEPFPAALQYWPWMDIFGAAADPQDTISPLEIDVMDYDLFRTGIQFETVIVGYDWRWSDIP